MSFTATIYNKLMCNGKEVASLNFENINTFPLIT